MEELVINIEEDWEKWLEQEHHRPSVIEISEKSHPNRREINSQINHEGRPKEYEEIQLMTDEEDVEEIHIIIVSDDETEAILHGTQNGRKRKRKRRTRPAKRKPKSKQVNPIQ
jgi:predicted MarR family transcription regulator